jgi:hypothetical protein
MLGQPEQLRGQLARRLLAQLLHSLASVGETLHRAVLYPCFLALNPRALLFGK